MKTLLTTVGIALSLNLGYAQEEPTYSPPPGNDLDSLLINVDQSSVTSGIIYERTTQFANLYNFNRREGFETADYTYFRQALLEMRNASNDSLFISLEQLEAQTLPDSLAIVPVAILDTDFQVMNYRPLAPEEGGLVIGEDSLYEQIPDRPPFLTSHTTVIAPLDNAIKASTVTYRFRESVYFKNPNGKSIETLTADFGSGPVTIISEGILIEQDYQVSYEGRGERTVTFTMTYTDGTIKYTHSEIYVLNDDDEEDTIECAGETFPKYPTTLEADIPFKGYNLSDPEIKAKIEYRIFYADNNQLKQVKNPVIILDGFDPGDKRRILDCDCEQDPDCLDVNDIDASEVSDEHDSIQDFQIYFDSEDIPRNALETLRFSGYDVIIVNHPTYVAKRLDGGFPRKVRIDGGAYYIESNAMALIKLIQVANDWIDQNNPGATIRLIGPSMGGQISRYALNYMEREHEQDPTNDDWDHNVSHWISIDSPHLGANIPLGTQALVYQLAGQSDEANRFFYEELGSPAAKQQLIEFYRNVDNSPTIPFAPTVGFADPDFLNARAYQQGYPAGRGSNYFKYHYDNQAVNGAYQSYGWPKLPMKVAIVNGSLTGDSVRTNGSDPDGIPYIFASPGENVLRAEVYDNVVAFDFLGQRISWEVVLATMESYFLSAQASLNKIARFNKRGNVQYSYAANQNDRGVMDNVPGGWFKGQGLVAESIEGDDPPLVVDILEFDIFGSNVDIDIELGYADVRIVRNNPVHSFIPSFSAIAHEYPDQSWYNPLDYNLTCPSDRQTPFDTYFGYEVNTQHTSFTEESVNWMLDNMASNVPMDPVYPIRPESFEGPDMICVGETAIYGFENECKMIGDGVFSATPVKLSYTGNDGYFTQVTGLSDGPATVNVVTPQGHSITKQVYVGVPVVGGNLVEVDPGEVLSLQPPSHNYCEMVGVSIRNWPYFHLVDEVEMRKIGNAQSYWDGDLRTGKDMTAVIFPQCNELFEFEVRARNACGWSEWKSFSINLNVCNGNCSSTGVIASDNFIISPVPVSGTLSINFTSNPTWTFTCLQSGGGSVTTTDPHGNSSNCTYYMNIQFYDGNGVLAMDFPAHSCPGSMDLSSLTPGTYIMVISHMNQTESHQIQVL